MMDSINHFNADIEVSEYDHIYKRDSSYSTLIGCKYGLRDKRYELVCSVNEFNQLVTELSNWQPTLPKVETVEVDGMVYEIGKLYMFKDFSSNIFNIGLLKDVDIDSGYKFKIGLGGNGDWFQECKEIPYEDGTIAHAPVKLIDGEVYLVDVECGLYKKKRVPLTYSKSDDEFFTVGCCFSISDCTNITHLTAANK